MIPHAIRHVFFTPFAAVLMLLAAPDLHAAPAAEANTIVLRDFHFSPMSLTVSPDATVIWKNLDDEPHTVVSVEGLFRSGGLDQNDSFTFKFDKPGTYRFLCSIRPKCWEPSSSSEEIHRVGLQNAT